MDASDEEEYTFVCPGCEESLEVNGSMKATLIERGCVFCGTDVTRAAFTQPPSSSPN